MTNSFIMQMSLMHNIVSNRHCQQRASGSDHKTRPSPNTMHIASTTNSTHKWHMLHVANYMKNEWRVNYINDECHPSISPTTHSEFINVKCNNHPPKNTELKSQILQHSTSSFLFSLNVPYHCYHFGIPEVHPIWKTSNRRNKSPYKSCYYVHLNVIYYVWLSEVDGPTPHVTIGEEDDEDCIIINIGMGIVLIDFLFFPIPL